MDEINLNDYKVKEIVYEDDRSYDEIIQYLLSILNDRSIPEKNKVDVRKQFDEVIRLKSITMPPPKVVLEKKEEQDYRRR